MGIPCSLSPMGCSLKIEDGYLVVQKFGVLNPNPMQPDLKKGYYWLLAVGAGGKRKSDAWGNNAAGGTGACLDCILRFAQDTEATLWGWAYGAGENNWCTVNDRDGAGYAGSGCGAEAVSVWAGGKGGKFYTNSEYVSYVRDAKVGIDGGSKAYHNSPWGAIGAANWNYSTDKSLIRLNNQGLASDGYMELWYVGSLYQPKLKYIPPISTNTWDQSQTIDKKELGI